MSASSLNHNFAHSQAHAIYRCRLIHERLEPRHHKFAYGLFMLYLDLDRLDTLDRLWPISVNRLNIFSFFESDHLKQNLFQDQVGDQVKNQNQAKIPLGQRVRELVKDGGIFEPVLSVTLLTLPRIFNYVFNPVSFYFLFGENKKPLVCVIEVTNTFKEMKTYLIKAASKDLDSQDLDSKNLGGGIFEKVVAKHFYVSPFGELADSFHFVVPVPDERLAVVINTVRGESDATDGRERKIMCANLNGQLSALTSAALVSNLVRYPLLTLKVIFMIHFQAFLLFLKKVPFHAKDYQPGLQTDVFNRRKEKANG